jgi:eukaryotic-like serine/threonine-protein kinase
LKITAGTKLGRYEIRSKIGAGGMGEVYRAEDTQLHRRVALKVFPAEFANDKTRLQRFAQEARSAASVNHPHIAHIYEIAEVEGVNFIAMEFVEGKSLRYRMNRASMKLGEIVGVAIQVADALSAAHKARIIHRDIKPENIMLRRDGYVKVLDFGLAKLADPKTTIMNAEGPTLINTDAGVVMGTHHYMSPEQAAGKPVDARTDIWSLGVILYEMVARSAPFMGDTPTEIIARVLEREPVPLSTRAPDTPLELQSIVAKALVKNRNERYQTVKDMLRDLKDLKQELEFASETERTVSNEGAKAATLQQDRSLMNATLTDGRTVQAPPTSSAEYLVSQIKSHRKSVMLVLSALLITAAGLSYSFYFRRDGKAPALTDRDTVLLADFVNTTGDTVFDGALKQGLAVQLQQSPFLNIFPDARIRETLRLMGRSPDERVTDLIAREICQRQGLKAFISGSITNLGNNYAIALKAVNAQTGDEMARDQIEAEGKEQVLKALGEAASQIREKLGESLSSIQKFDAPIKVTTSSLEALKAYSLGHEAFLRGKFLESIPFYKRAIDLDPNFAYAYMALAVTYGNTEQPALASENTAKAFALRDRVTEVERFRISDFYYQFVTGEIDKEIEVLILHQKTYPRDFSAPENLSNSYLLIGQFGKAIEAAHEGLAGDPKSIPLQANLGEAFIHLNQFAEAKEIFDRIVQQFDDAQIRTRLFRIAFARGDTAAMQQQLDWANGKPDEYVALDWQTSTAGCAGQWQKAQDFSRRSIALATHSDAKEVAAGYAAEHALRAAIFGQSGQAKAEASQSLALKRNQVTLVRAALALALAGDASRAQSLIDELVKQYPKDTLINGLWLPAIRAATELQQGKSAKAIELLEDARRYEPMAEFWPQYLRALAYLKLNKGAEAAVEFQKILDHRGEAPLSALYPLAHLGLGRAAILSGNKAKARTAYQDFFALWKDADANIPILSQARLEYESLK